MTELFALAGSYALHPGQRPSITGQRPVLSSGLLSRVLRGRGTDQVEQMLGQVFSLCAHAHRRTARLALHAAQFCHPIMLPEPPSPELNLQTALDHLRSMATDWSSPGPRWAKPCPVPLAQRSSDMSETQTAAALNQLGQWLESSVLHQPIGEWLAQNSTPETLLAWCQHNASAVPPARFLSDCHAHTAGLHTTYRPLDLLDPDLKQQASQLQQLALTIGDQPAFAQQPTWQGHCAETGAWTRVRRHQAGAYSGMSSADGASVWTRLASRWWELVALCADNAGQDSAAAGLSSGGLNLGRGQALGWCEMARGLLLHWVQLDAQGKVLAYQVVAPTEWNFHPDGALAKALMQLAPQNTTGASLLGKAFDACVDCQVSPGTSPESLNA